MDLQIDYQRYVDVADGWIADQPKTVLLVFLLFSAGFSTGLGQSGASSGTSQFTEDVTMYQAFEEVNDNFGRVTFEEDTGTIQLIQSESNILSKPELPRMPKAQQRLQANPELSVVQTTSAARAAARAIDPSVTTIDEEIDAVEQAVPTEIDRAVQVTVERSPSVRSSLSEDFNARSASVLAMIGTVTHSLTTEMSDSAGTGGDSPLTEIRRHVEFTVGSVDGDTRVFGSGILSEEFSLVIGDSLALVAPAVVVSILFFLVSVYRDPIDLLIGVISLAVAVLWTLGFMGLARIALSQMLIAVLPLLLAVGTDFGIHAINRYREERTEGFGIHESMRTATDQLLVAFTIVTGTMVIGFAANASSELGPIRDFGIAAAVGIVFTFFIFGIFLPAAKVYLDSLRERAGFPEFGSESFGAEDSILGRILPVGIHIACLVPRALLALLIASTVWMKYYRSGVDSRSTQDSFLPLEDNPEYLELFPQQLQPRDYTVIETASFLENNFQVGGEDATAVYVEGSLTDGGALEPIWRAGDSLPNSFIVDDDHARKTSIITAIQSYAERDPEFAALVTRNGRDANGIPDDGLEQIYDELLDSPARGQAFNYITDDYTPVCVKYAAESDASQTGVTEDTHAVADHYRVKAMTIDNVVILKAVSDATAQLAFISLMLALGGSTIFLTIIYTLFEGRPSLGIVNLVPIVVIVIGITTTMCYLDISFNVMTGTILSIGIGLGINYSAHLVHWFVKEYSEGTDVLAALTDSVRGTGGVLADSVLMAVTGIDMFAIAITPILGQLGLLTGVSTLYPCVVSLAVLPPAPVVWARLVHGEDAKSTDAASGPDGAGGAV